MDVIRVLQLRDKEQSIFTLKRGMPLFLSKAKPWCLSAPGWAYPADNACTITMSTELGKTMYKYNSSKVRDADFDRILKVYKTINNIAVETAEDGLEDDLDPEPNLITGFIATSILHGDGLNTTIPNPADD